jgi:dienelactone hydrolase
MRRILFIAMLVMATGAGAQTPAETPPVMPASEIVDAGPDGVRVDQDGVFGNFYPGKGEGRRPAILLLSGSEGGVGFGTARIAEALAAEGFGVLQICYFGCPGFPQKLVNVPLETFSRGLAWLRAQPSVDKTRIAIVGGSKGAEAALLAATRDRGVKAVVATQPTSVVWPGIAYSPQMQPGWTVNGEPIAFLPYADVPKTDIFAGYHDALPNLTQHPGAIIPVERIAARIMLVCGEADTLWPSCPMTDQIVARLKAKGRPAPLVLRYPDAGHEVFGLPIDKSNPHYARLGSLGGTPQGIAAAHADGWPRTVAFLKQALSR